MVLCVVDGTGRQPAAGPGGGGGAAPAFTPGPGAPAQVEPPSRPGLWSPLCTLLYNSFLSRNIIPRRHTLLALCVAFCDPVCPPAGAGSESIKFTGKLNVKFKVHVNVFER